MRALFSILSLAATTIAFEVNMKSFDLFDSSSKGKKIYSSTESSQLSPSIVLKDGILVEVEISPSEPIPAQVSLLFTPDRKNSSSLGVFPSVQVSLFSIGNSLYRGELLLAGSRGLSANGGVYTVFLLVAGDSISPLKVPLGKAKIEGSSERAFPLEFQALPVINHEFRGPHATADPLISSVFTGIVLLVPLALFGLGLFCIRINLKGLSSVYSSLFFLGTVAYGSLMGMFFLALNLVQTVVGAVVLATPMVFVGHKLLSQLRTAGDLLA